MKRWWQQVAKVDIKMPEEFLQCISRLGSDFDPAAEKVLEAGGEIVLAKAQSNLSSVVGNGTKYESRSTGELESALSVLCKDGQKRQPQYQGWLCNLVGMVSATQNWQISSNTANTVSLLNLFMKPAKTHPSLS